MNHYTTSANGESTNANIYGNGGYYGYNSTDNNVGSNHGRNSLERFEQSLNKINTPKWMMSATRSTDSNGRTGSSSWRATSADSRYSNGTDKAATLGSTTATAMTTRYSDYRRSYSAQRCAQSSSYWSSAGQTTSGDYQGGPMSHSRPLSREPSPVPGSWSRPPTAPAVGGRYSRWSASTLCDSTYSGQNTPTDSVVSGRSLLDNGVGVAATTGYTSSLTRDKKPYLGWRSQENVSDPRYGRLTPADRLATSLRRSQQSGLDRVQHHGSLNSSMSGAATGWRGSLGGTCRSSLSRDPGPPPDWFIHDSIRSVSSAIAEFCKADDVPALPLSTEERIRRRQCRTTKNRVEFEPRNRLVWLESSFVSNTPTTTVHKA